ncbi:MAG: EAL domain-containing protein [Leptospiraceae bacterium]|nr:EAL domain-containing protein [Leptospiraceae bacterium]
MLEKDLSEKIPDFLGEDSFVPHYQPIIQTSTRNIIGYEVLGRHFVPPNEYRSVGPRFHNPDVNIIENINIDRIVREKAIKHLKESGSNTKLFFNMMPNLLSAIHREDLLDPERFHIIQLIEKYGIDRKNIVIEITEEEFKGEIERLLLMVNVFRNYGFKIAIDDMGVGSSNLERIGYIHPDIIKVDIKIMRESLNKTSFRQVLSAISEMSIKLGSDLLFEGVETEEELTLALSMGANLLQGFYFSRATKEFQSRSQFSKDLKIILEKFSGLRFLEIVQDFQRQQDIVNQLSNILHGIEKKEGDELFRYVAEVLRTFPENISHLFFCDLHGYQITPTYERKEGSEWKEVIGDIGNNFAWKPYFAQHKAEIYHFKRRWGVTEPLYDLQSRNQYIIFTFSITDSVILIAKVLLNS